MYIPAAPLSESVLEELGLDPDRVRLHYDGGFRDPLIEQIGQTVYREVSTPGPADRLLIEHLTSALAVHVLRNHSNQNAAALRLPRAAGALTRQRLKRIDDFVEANLDRDLPLSALAREACLSPYHFARAFKASTGTPPHRYVIARRVERAKALIHDQSLPLADIAVACGFSSQAHFTTVFLKATGQTPGVYRNDRC
jgi:AraC family transcriptional regulator